MKINRKKYLLRLFVAGVCILPCGHTLWAQNADTLRLMFVGDIMGHDSQINAAYDSNRDTYDYSGVFEKVKPLFSTADVVVANLEVTLAGPPFKGYPQFSSPDELAVAAQQSGIDVLVTANNHTCDRRKQGILRTLDVLDSLQIPHTGSFRSPEERNDNNLLLVEQNNIRVGLLNYTYGTNGIPVPSPTVVNRIDWKQMAEDIAASKALKLDKLIVVLHWGKEYQSHPDEGQEKLAAYLFDKGADVIIGAHPHVLQRMEYHSDDQGDKLIAYSLGNFVSNQRVRKRDGGALVSFELVKKDSLTRIVSPGYHLIWVNKPLVEGRKTFQVVPGKSVEEDAYRGLSDAARQEFEIFMSDSRKLLNAENIGVPEK